MVKAERFNNLLNKLHKKEEEKKRQEIRLQKEIQLQIRLVEDALNDMENKFKQALDGKCDYPKFTLVKFPLQDEVKKELIINQGYFLDESFGQTKIFYNKKLFDEYRSNTKENSFTSKKDIENKVYEELAKSNENTPHTKDEFEENITKLLKNVVGDKRNDIKIIRY